MMVAQATTSVRADADTVREAVLDPVAYTRGDTKVAQIEVLERTDSGVLARIHGSFGPIRSTILARYTVRGDVVDLDMIAGRLRGFHAIFRIEGGQGEGTVRLTHREEYDFGYGPFTPLVERLLRGWAQRSVEAEVEALRRAAEERAVAAA
jgi:polyketide cyclase/dehydrase/lipid transport protein